MNNPLLNTIGALVLALIALAFGQFVSTTFDTIGGFLPFFIVAFDGAVFICLVASVGLATHEAFVRAPLWSPRVNFGFAVVGCLSAAYFFGYLVHPFTYGWMSLWLFLLPLGVMPLLAALRQPATA